MSAFSFHIWNLFCRIVFIWVVNWVALISCCAVCTRDVQYSRKTVFSLAHSSIGLQKSWDFVAHSQDSFITAIISSEKLITNLNRNYHRCLPSVHVQITLRSKIFMGQATIIPQHSIYASFRSIYICMSVCFDCQFNTCRLTLNGRPLDACSVQLYILFETSPNAWIKTV